ncbi:MAG TPA: glycosyltransferase family 39 protein [Candidatus Limnocylindrales bacterium]|nr:glycosyltransferase family 39 protein [Candidatus Limnocylindrales bacterium]
MRTPLLLYALALGVRLILIAHFPDPTYPDSFYYADVARSLAAGHGFNVDFLWIFAEVGGHLPANPTLPIPSNAHWMPLASIVQVPFLLLFGNAGWAGDLPFALVGALAAPLAWRIGVDAGARRFVAVGAGVLAALPTLVTPFLAQPDNFGLYEPAVAGALWLTARALKGGQHAGRDYALAGLLVGLATLSRNDGVIAGAVVGLAFVWDRWRARRAADRAIHIPLSAAVACAGLFALCVVPWFARQLAVFGTLSPSTASGKVFFIRDIGEWDSITTPATLDHLLGMGIGPLLVTRIEGLIAAVSTFSVLVGAIALVPFMVVGAWSRRRSVDFGPFFGYALALFAFSALVSAVHVPGGTFIHSAIALAPHVYVLAVEGVFVATGWVAARRRSWDREAAGRVFGGAMLAFGVVAAVAASFFVHGTWAESRGRLQAIGPALADAGAAPTDRVMSIDASGTKYWSGHGGVVLVNDPLDTIAQVARAYDVRWLVLDRTMSVAPAKPILDGTVRPAWLGPPVYAIAADGSNAEGLNRGAGAYDFAIWPVCPAAGTDVCPPPTADAAR